MVLCGQQLQLHVHALPMLSKLPMPPPLTHATTPSLPSLLTTVFSSWRPPCRQEVCHQGKEGPSAPFHPSQLHYWQRHPGKALHCMPFALWSTPLTPALSLVLSPPAPHAAQARPQPLRALASLRARAAPEEDPAGAPEGASLDQPVQACSGPQPGRRGVQAPCQVSC